MNLPNSTIQSYKKRFTDILTKHSNGKETFDTCLGDFVSLMDDIMNETAIAMLRQEEARLSSQLVRVNNDYANIEKIHYREKAGRDSWKCRVCGNITWYQSCERCGLTRESNNRKGDSK